MMQHMLYDLPMAKIRTTVTLDEDVWKRVKVRAARAGVGESEVLERALRKDLGFDLLDTLWAKADVPADEALEIAVREQHAARADA